MPKIDLFAINNLTPLFRVRFLCAAFFKENNQIRTKNARQEICDKENALKLKKSQVSD